VVLPTVSWHRDEYAALGVPFGRRGDILDEQLEIWSRAWAGSPLAFGGRHYRFGDVWLEPQPYRPGGPVLWFGGSSVHRRLIGRLVRYGSGFNPLGQPDDVGLARLAAALAAAGRSPAELEYARSRRRPGLLAWSATSATHSRSPGRSSRPSASSAGWTGWRSTRG
jgi:alkanesulfonate monooxygenase SsuD/methylene tetrahydromethanopterin reductase-like flavin-dependent oxidoreductase (luciferase family)